jgi:hypothetical protein
MARSDKSKSKVVSLSGHPVEHYRDGPKPFEPPKGETALPAITQHIERHLGPIEAVFHELVSDAVHIDVHHVLPTAKRPYHALVTSGMSDLAMNVPAGADVPRFLELMVTLPRAWRVSQEAFADEAWYWPVRQLKTLARFPHKYDTWLGSGHTVTNGEPAQPLATTTKLCGAILLPALGVPAGFNQLRISDEKVVHFLAVVPLYEEEMALKMRDGTSVLIERLGKQRVTDVVDPQRKNAVRKKS